MAVDYSLYLVTDSTKAVLGDRDLVSVVKAAIEGGVTVVQYRDKTNDTGELIRVAHELHKVTGERGVPLIINDRVDVALAVGAEGVHIGQDDMDITTARRLLGKDAIIGVTVCSVEEALRAVEAGADYLGIGTVFATPTKTDAKSIIGVPGLRAILTSLAGTANPTIPTVCIGGLNATNLQRVLFQSATPSKSLTGVALVSAIISSPDPRSTSSHLRSLLTTPPPFALHKPPATTRHPTTVLSAAGPHLRALAKTSPLAHNMTNTVVQNLCANIALALSASPIMSTNGHEAGDLAALRGSLVVNMGTATPAALTDFELALKAYNDVGGPVLLDPVGAGATHARRAAVRRLLGAGYFDVIKGNEAEILTVLKEGGGGPVGGVVGGVAGSEEEIKQHGVDSRGGGLSEARKASAARRLAERERNVVIMTGETDYVSDGRRTYAVENGHALLGAVTGSGCALGTVLAAFAALERMRARGEVEDWRCERCEPGEERGAGSELCEEGGMGSKLGDERSVGSGGGTTPEDMLQAVLAGTLVYEIAAERAAAREDVRGPGTFVPAFIDELYGVRRECEAGDYRWVEAARVRRVDV